MRADAGAAGEAAGAVGRAGEALGGLDVLVDNAGVGVLGPGPGTRWVIPVPTLIIRPPRSPREAAA